MDFTQLVLWLFVIDLGIASGAGLYEALIVVPQWFPYVGNGGEIRVDSRTMRRMDTGRRFWGGVTTMPLTLLTITSLILTWHSQSTANAWYFYAALVTLIERLATFAFFIPTALKLMHADTAPSGASSLSFLARWWARVNWIRIMFNLAAWLAALKALSLFDAAS
jgi:hypothetical protein